MFKNKLLHLITLFILLGLFLVACGSSQTEEPNAVVETAALSSDATSSENEAEIVLVTEKTDDSQTAVSPITAETEDETEDEVARPDGWSDETHSNDVDPNYDVVFPDDEVNTMTITIDPANWQAMLDDMTATYGELGSSRQRGGGGQGGPGQGGNGQARPEQPPQGELDGVPPVAPDGIEGGAPPVAPDGIEGGARPGGQAGGFAGGEVAAENPIWVAGDIEFEGDVWTDVGVRFKGNSSLMNTWSNGSLELPFKLDFDEFEDENPAIDNQRFYGFKQLSLSNNLNDSTFMHDTVAYDMMAEAGIASAETAYYELFVDYGEGPVSFGLYTMIEVVDDTVVERIFGDDDGNIYEADGTAVSLAEGTFDGISSSFQKENNEDEVDWSDIEALYTVLHSDTRQTDADAWKAELESSFDVDTFLHWLAINTVIENWDTYGGMTHNFYLYNNPETGLLTWIPWDYNEAFTEGRRSSMSLSMDAIGDNWPLISFLLADSDYYDIYVNYVDETINTVFVADEMVEKYQEIASLIEPYATEKVGETVFNQGVQALIDHTYARVAAAESFLAESGQ